MASNYEKAINEIDRVLNLIHNTPKPSAFKIDNAETVIIKNNKFKGYDQLMNASNIGSLNWENNDSEASQKISFSDLLLELKNLLKNNHNKEKIQECLKKVKNVVMNNSNALKWITQIAVLIGLSI